MHDGGIFDRVNAKWELEQAYCPASIRSLSISKGQTAEILIASDGTQAHLLPQSALTLNDDGALGVRTVNDKSKVVFYES